jgi:hypothetical protein
MSTESISIFGASILFVRGNTVYTHLSAIVKSTDDEQFKALKSQLDLIYQSANTLENRNKLQDFITQYGDQINLEYSKIEKSEFNYNLKLS